MNEENEKTVICIKGMSNEEVSKSLIEAKEKAEIKAKEKEEAILKHKDLIERSVAMYNDLGKQGGMLQLNDRGCLKCISNHLIFEIYALEYLSEDKENFRLSTKILDDLYEYIYTSFDKKLNNKMPKINITKSSFNDCVGFVISFTTMNIE